MANESFANTLLVEINSTKLPADLANLLVYAYVDDSRNLPDMFMLRFKDPDQVVVQKANIQIAAPIKLKVQTADPAGPEVLLDGEITAVELNADKSGTYTEIRGYDKAHRFTRGRRVAAYPNMTISDIVRKVAQRAKIPAGDIDNIKGFGGDPQAQLSQDNVSDADFLQRLADLVGAQFAVVDGKLNFKLPEPPKDAPSATAKASKNPQVLELGRNLIAIRATVTAAEQVPEVESRGWDPKQKKFVSQKGTPKPSGIEVAGLDPVGMAGKVGAPPLLAANSAWRTQATVQANADALAAQFGTAAAELEGVAQGNPKLRAGEAVSLANVAQMFAGKYTLTTTRHLFSPEAGYTTAFTVSHRQDRSFYGLTSGSTDASATVSGPVPAVVTDLKDPDKLGRVKVKFPWMSDDYNSGWARTVQATAGNTYGSVFLPEVGDEVLVDFENGDFDAPYVLGGLYNGKDAPPKLAAEPVDSAGGKVNVRALVSRTHHRLELIDDPQVDAILLSTGDDKLLIKLDHKNQNIEVTSSKTIAIKAQSGIKIDSGTGTLEMKGQKVTINSQTDYQLDANAGIKMKANAAASLEGATVKVAGQGTAEFSAGAINTIKGAMVKIN
ncbi:VgrG-related protein [Fodinicola acaciae]|uniref:VgrG-related protein n=1 Tax=Fodinicola acaciae TaxID=2681555 RepID=UPI0013D5305D|nr:VgrG-related protein [Fodinicola acaciae]